MTVLWAFEPLGEGLRPSLPTQPGEALCHQLASSARSHTQGLWGPEVPEGRSSPALDPAQGVTILTVPIYPRGSVPAQFGPSHFLLPNPLLSNVSAAGEARSATHGFLPPEALAFCNRSHQWSLCHPCQLGGLPPALELPLQVRADVGVGMGTGWAQGGQRRWTS